MSIPSWSQRGTNVNSSRHGDNPLVSTNKDPNRDKILARYNQPRTSETYRRQDDVFGYELQFLLSEVLLVFQNLSNKLQRRLYVALSVKMTNRAE